MSVQRIGHGWLATLDGKAVGTFETRAKARKAIGHAVCARDKALRDLGAERVRRAGRAGVRAAVAEMLRE